MTSLIAARAVQGADGGIATPLSLVLISEAYPLARRGMVVRCGGPSPRSRLRGPGQDRPCFSMYLHHEDKATGWE
jgi:hypothetical protein